MLIRTPMYFKVNYGIIPIHFPAIAKNLQQSRGYFNFKWRHIAFNDYWYLNRAVYFIQGDKQGFLWTF